MPARASRDTHDAPRPAARRWGAWGKLAGSGLGLPRCVIGRVADCWRMTEGDSQIAPTTRAETRASQRRRWAFVLFLLPIAAVIAPAFYSRISPRLGGVPFFIWYQFAGVVFGGVITAIVYLLRGTERELSEAKSPETGQK